MEIDTPESYTYDGECLKKAEEMGKPGLEHIRAKQDTFLFTAGPGPGARGPGPGGVVWYTKGEGACACLHKTIPASTTPAASTLVRLLSSLRTDALRIVSHVRMSMSLLHLSPHHLRPCFFFLPPSCCRRCKSHRVHRITELSLLPQSSPSHFL